MTTMRIALTAGLIIGLATGLAVGLKVRGRGSPGNAPSPASPAHAAAKSAIDYVPAPPRFTQEEVASHRESWFTDLKSVDDVISLPTDFSQTEALYALAGRADADELREYILQATGIANRWDRRAALQILFLRYSEIDADAAIDFLQSMRLDIDTQVIAQMFQSWAKVDLNGAIDAANRIGNAQRRKTAGTAILNAYAQNDPGMLRSVEASLVDTYNLDDFDIQALNASASHTPLAALQQAMTMQSTQARMRAISSIGHIWARQDPRAALAAADAIDDAQLRRMFRHSVLNRWTRDDPDSSLDVVLNLPDGQQKAELVSVAVANLSANDPHRALSIVQQLTGEAKRNAYRTLFQTWANNDPRAAVRELDNLQDTIVKNQLLHSVAGSYAHRYPDEALAWAKQLQSAGNKEIWQNVIVSLARTNPQMAIEAALQSTSNPRSDQVISNVLLSAARSRPQLAATYIERLPQGQIRDQAITQIASQWAATDPDGALEWIGGLSGDAYARAISNVAQQIAWRDPDKAAQYVVNVSGPARENWIGSVAESYARHDPDRAINWIRQFEGDPAYGPSLARIVPRLAEHDPAAALNLARGLDDSLRVGAIQNAISQWSTTDPAAAANWAVRATDPLERAEALRTVAANWVHYDSRAATRWAIQLPGGDDRDQVLVAMAYNMSDDPERLMSMLNAIGSQDQRDLVITNLYTQIVSYDRVAAGDFLSRSGISPDHRQRLLERSGGR